MLSLKALKSIHLIFSLQSRCAGLALTQQLTARKLKSTNPDCKVTYEVKRPGGEDHLRLAFADAQKEELNITEMHAGQVMEHIKSRVAEKDMHAVLTKHEFVGKKLSTEWGL